MGIQPLIIAWCSWEPGGVVFTREGGWAVSYSAFNRWEPGRVSVYLGGWVVSLTNQCHSLINPSGG